MLTDYQFYQRLMAINKIIEIIFVSILPYT
ncbi:uncharacterized protein METZ01_LOCUS469831 [marine metagenome]|uniref:Uncharacterized protein n=1 Tax=marine metagenome TaxID=408172 RepID=A0A383BA24_9ZZZZ